jgi:hypothetical protein
MLTLKQAAKRLVLDGTTAIRELHSISVEDVNLVSMANAAEEN